MDINLPKVNGIQATSQITADIEGARVIVLTAYHDDEQLFHALKAGAAAYYPRNVDARKALSAIHAVHSGNYVIGEEVMAEAAGRRLAAQAIELVVFDESPSECSHRFRGASVQSAADRSWREQQGNRP